MSGEPKPLTQMTPREAWEHAWEQAIDACRVFEEEAAAKQLEAVRNLGRQMLDQDQEEEGVPVVARDEAAELRAENAQLKAENERLRAAIREWAESDLEGARAVGLNFRGTPRHGAAKDVLHSIASEGQ